MPQASSPWIVGLGDAGPPTPKPLPAIVGRPIGAVMRRGRRADGRSIECALCADPDEQNAGSRMGMKPPGAASIEHGVGAAMRRGLPAKSRDSERVTSGAWELPTRKGDSRDDVSHE